MNPQTTTIQSWSVVALVVLVIAPSVFSQRGVTQPPEVVEAYAVCAQFQKIMSVNLDFDRAFEAAFTKDPKRRREIAITEGEFGIDVRSVDDASLIKCVQKSNADLFSDTSVGWSAR